MPDHTAALAVLETFDESLDAFTTFPRNLIASEQYPYTLQRYAEKVIKNKSRLFCEDDKANVTLWDFNEQDAKNSRQLRKLSDVKQALRESLSNGVQDPMGRFFFVNAPDSRAKLNVTYDMLMYIFSYHQVMSTFLDFLFSFGKQIYQQDFHSSGFRIEDRLGDLDRGCAISNLGRSGRGFELCYSLKAVEFNESALWQWPIRQTAVHHSFDTDNGRSTWIIIKANDKIKNRLKVVSESSLKNSKFSFSSRSRAFASDLESHSVICDWAGENWRAFINFLEERLDDLTRRTKSATVSSSKIAPQTSNSSSEDSPPKRTLTRQFTAPLRQASRVLSSKWNIAPAEDVEKGSLEQSSSSAANTPTFIRQQFSFEDLQKTQSIEEKANEALLVIKVNLDIMTGLKQNYKTMIDSCDFSAECRDSCARDIARFYRRIGSVIDDLRVQQSRLESLINVLSERKSLLRCILEYRSALEMGEMTREMHHIAKETENKTVSMTIITLVTLFFLPGTYISTLMSTDIIKYQSPAPGEEPQEAFSLAALKLYLAITLPLMFVTFLAWWAVYKWVKKKDAIKLEWENRKQKFQFGLVHFKEGVLNV